MSDVYSDADHEFWECVHLAPIFVVTNGQISRVLPMKIADFQIELPALRQR